MTKFATAQCRVFSEAKRLQRAIKYVKYAKYGCVDRLIKGKPLLTWGLRWIFDEVACAYSGIFTEVEHFTSGD